MLCIDTSVNMQSSLVLVAFATVVVFGLSRGEDECAPKPGEKPTHPGDCCKVDGIKMDGMKASIQTCMAKFPHPKPPGPPPAGGAPPKPSPEMKKHHACVAECVFEENKLLTADKKLDKDAITKFFVVDGEFMDATSAAVTKCLGSYEKDTDQSLECKSGAGAFEKCLMRETFLNCPSSAWTTSDDCTKLKTKVGKCPDMPIHMGHKPGPPPQ